jgi:hypothetical protein
MLALAEQQELARGVAVHAVLQAFAKRRCHELPDKP